MTVGHAHSHSIGVVISQTTHTQINVGNEFPLAQKSGRSFDCENEPFSELRFPSPPNPKSRRKIFADLPVDLSRKKLPNQNSGVANLFFSESLPFFRLPNKTLRDSNELSRPNAN